MGLVLATPPAIEPISLDEAKRQVRVEHTEEDSLLSDAIASARQFVELHTGRQLVTAVWELHMDCFPEDERPIVVPKPPLQEVTSIVYRDTAGTLQTWNSAEYLVEAPSGDYAWPGRVAPAPGEVYPATQERIGAVVVTFRAGYGDAGTDVPQRLRNAIKAGVGEEYRERERPDLEKAMWRGIAPFVMDLFE